ncbi:MAG: hypothetical protein GY757_18730 [bacterium]|nr:hypothetical protein [bacterium]
MKDVMSQLLMYHLWREECADEKYLQRGVKFLDGNFGMVIQLPAESRPGKHGVQVPDEQSIRWIEIEKIDGCLFEKNNDR